MKRLEFGLVSAALLSACAAVDDKSTQVSREEKPFVTGSNIPKRDKSSTNVQTVNPQALEHAAGSGASAPAPSR